ncbi:GNAT family N-acetyltransferase [Micromonospora purpureochromogenes]|uniref:RimJ/RimL family protein N-acetyltransferase n=1 Tax=Micromonospora purpureochromogenes TaxID=47872 RepID=A0ABX2RLL4_9ACTN|nr:GNAT family N-acetyltransferase [Micromonospora purpureochromogenes]NYF56066.1 RimJ/RimL family protein N-acetyltransferase [Micromonospora purpureochromogenes]
MIETERLRLAPLDVAAARAVAACDRDGRAWHAEFPREDDRDAAAMVLPQTDLTFGCRLIVERTSGLAVGTIGFFGPPDDTGTLIVGYGLVPSARGRGLATEALSALVAYGFAQPSVRTITADPLHDNVASHRVLEKAGFLRTHSTEDAHWYAIQRGPVNPTPAMPASDGSRQVKQVSGRR